LLLTFANRVRLLNKLPLVGSPKLRARAYLDGRGSESDPLVLRVPPEGRMAMLNLKIRNPARFDVHEADVGLLVAEGVRRWRVDHEGRPVNEGRWIKPTHEPVGDSDPHPWKDYWAMTTQFPGRDMDADWWFRLRFKRSGDYRLRLLIDSPALYGHGFAQNFYIRVAELQGDPTVVEQLDGVVDEGEQLLRLRPNQFTDDDAFQQDYLAFVLRAAEALPVKYMEGFNDLQADDTNPDAYASRDEVKALLAYLYEARRRIGGDQP
jgi:hypothetical protein